MDFRRIKKHTQATQPSDTDTRWCCSAATGGAWRQGIRGREWTREEGHTEEDLTGVTKTRLGEAG